MSAKDRLVELLAVQNLSQAEVARRIGEERDWVHKRTRGKLRIDADDIPRLARALGVSCSAFFEGSSCPEEAKKGPPLGTGEDDLLLEEYMKAAVSDLPEEERYLVDAVLALRRRYRLRGEGGPESGTRRPRKARQSDPARD